MSAELLSTVPSPDLPPGSTRVPGEDDRPEEERKELEERIKAFAPLHDYLNKTLDAIDALNKQERLEIYRTQAKSHLMYGGKTVLDWNPHENVWENALRPEDQVYTVPEYQSHVDTALVEVVRSRTELNCEPVDDTDPAKKELAEFCKARLDFHRQRKMNAFFSIREGLFLILSGTAFRYTFFSTDAGSECELVPMSERKAVTSEGLARCAYCGMPKGENEEQCAKCGGQRYTKDEPKTFEASVVTSYKKIPYGDVVIESVDPAEINISLHARKVSDSPYLVRKRLVMRALLEKQYGTIIPPTGIKDARLRLQRDIESGMGGDHEAPRNDKREGGEQFELLEFEQAWLSPALYYDYVLPKDARIGKKLLRAGTVLIKEYPRGMYLSRSGRKILDARNEPQIGHWEGVPFRLKPTQVYGGGFEHLMPLQEQTDKLRSLQFIDVYYNSVRREFVNTATGLTANLLSANPQSATEVHFDPQYNFTSAYHQESGQTALAHTLPLAQELSGNMQNSAGTFSSQGGAADVKLMGTATGAAIMREMQTNRYSPALWLRAEVDAEQGYQILELEQRYIARAKLEKLKGKYGERAVKEFMNADLRADIRVEPVPGSWMPQTEPQKLANVTSYLQLKTAARMPLTDEDLAMAADAYHVPLQMAEHSLTERIVQRNIEIFKELCELFEQSNFTDPLLAEVVYEQSGVGVNMLLDSIESLIEEYRDWHLSDEGRDASPLLTATVDFAVKQCYEAGKERAAYMASLQAEAMAPQAEAQLMLKEAQDRQQEETELRRAGQAMQVQDAQAGMEAQRAEEMASRVAPSEEELPVV